jgi:hypothetical protein
MFDNNSNVEGKIDGSLRSLWSSELKCKVFRLMMVKKRHEKVTRRNYNDMHINRFLNENCINEEEKKKKCASRVGHKQSIH